MRSLITTDTNTYCRCVSVRAKTIQDCPTQRFWRSSSFFEERAPTSNGNIHQYDKNSGKQSQVSSIRHQLPSR